MLVFLMNAELARRVEIKAVIFDNDGLLMDTEGIYIQNYENMGIHMNWDIRRRLIGRTGPDACSVIVSEFGLTESPLEFMARRDQLLRQMFPSAKLFDGAVEIVEHFAKHVVIGCATSSPRLNFLSKITHHQDFFRQFKLVICGDEVSKGKPDPEIYVRVAEGMGFKPDDFGSILVFEDAPSGVKAANLAGMPVVMIPDPKLPLDQALADYDAHPDFIFPSLKEVDLSRFSFVQAPVDLP